MSDPTVTVSAPALRAVLQALIGEPHYIRELQVTRSPAEIFTDNPINVLLEQYNAQCDQPSPGDAG